MPSYNTEKWALQAALLNDSQSSQQFFYEGEVWHCLLGLNIGHEQNGDRSSFMRPVLIIQRFGAHIFWAVPLSTKLPLGSQHHHLFEHEGKEYSALVTQLRALDERRLVRKLYEIDSRTFYEIKLHLARNLLRTQNRTPS